MLKATAQRNTRTGLVEAALETLKHEGFAGASARAIARRGGFNQALVFYHFGSVNQLLLAALDATSERRMHAYRVALESAETIEDLVRVAGAIYQEDLASGHITVLTEMIAGSLTHPELGPEIAARMEPWVAFAEEAIGKALRSTGLEGLVPTRDLAFGVVGLYLGIEMLTHLDGDRHRAEALFALGSNLVGVLSPLFRPGANA